MRVCVCVCVVVMFVYMFVPPFVRVGACVFEWKHDLSPTSTWAPALPCVRRRGPRGRNSTKVDETTQRERREWDRIPEIKLLFWEQNKGQKPRTWEEETESSDRNLWM